MSTFPDPFQASDALVDQLAALRPMTASYMGIRGHDDRWDDLSPEGAARFAAMLAEHQAQLAALPEPTSRWQRLAIDVMGDYLAQELGRYRSGDHLYDLNSMASSFQSLRQVFDVMDTTSAAGWANITARLERLEGACAGYRALLEEGRKKGRVSSVRQVTDVIRQGHLNAGSDSFFVGLPKAFAAAGIDDPALGARLEGAIPRARAAFAKLTVYLEETYLPSAQPHDAVGRERYLREARRFLGADIDPEETYAWGWSQVRRLAADMRACAARIAPGRTTAEVIELLRSDPARCAPTAGAFIAVMLERQQRALADLDGTHFDIPASIRRVDVKVAPPGPALGAYYIPPSEDFTRAGTVWYLLPASGPYPLYDEISTAYHEGFPGHHLQCGTQVSLTDRLCRLQRLGEGYAGYAEGWALYVEQLMLELGYYERDDYVFGLYTNQMIRSLRVVIDIGAHLDLPIPDDAPFLAGERWTFERGVELLHTVAGLPIPYAESEIRRYLGWPGQAIAYKVGERKMLELRDELRGKLGPGFSLKDFHARVLGSGPVGLERLRGLVLDPG